MKAIGYYKLRPIDEEESLVDLDLREAHAAQESGCSIGKSVLAGFQ